VVSEGLRDDGAVAVVGGLKPVNLLGSYAALKRRSSTVLQAFSIHLQALHVKHGGKQQVPRLRVAIRCANCLANLGMTDWGCWLTRLNSRAFESKIAPFCSDTEAFLIFPNQ
jgi:hypothetical protein